MNNDLVIEFLDEKNAWFWKRRSEGVWNGPFNCRSRAYDDYQKDCLLKGLPYEQAMG